MSHRKTVRAAAVPAARRGSGSGSGSKAESSPAIASLRRRPAIFRLASQEKVIRLPRWALCEIRNELDRLADLVRCLPNMSEGGRIGEIESRLGLKAADAEEPDMHNAADTIAASVHRRLARIAKAIERLVQG